MSNAPVRVNVTHTYTSDPKTVFEALSEHENLGPVFGALTLAIVQLGIFFAGIDTDWYRVVVGSLLLVAVLFNESVRRFVLRVRR